jgi:hypothetical protein
MRSIFEECITAEDWRTVIEALLRDAKDGNVAAFRELSPWVVGRVPEEAKVRHSGALTTLQMPDLSKLTDAELAQALAIAQKLEAGEGEDDGLPA